MDKYLEGHPGALYEKAEGKDLLQFSVEAKSFDVASIVYFRLRDDILNGRSRFSQPEQSRILTGSLLGLLPHFYEDISSYILFDRIIQENCRAVDLKKVLAGVKEKYGKAMMAGLQDKINYRLATSKGNEKLICLPEDYSL